jgi:hypothetical protein
MPQPPEAVSTQLPPVNDDEPLNNRHQLSLHLTNPNCANCHRLVDPIGFGLERYDAIGQFRETQFVEIRPTVDEQRTKRKTKPTEYHIPIDTTAYIQGIENSEFSTPREAGELLANDPVCRRCTVKQLFRYALGRHETEQDQAAIDQAFQQFEDSQFDFRELIIAIAVSQPFVGADQ